MLISRYMTNITGRTSGEYSLKSYPVQSDSLASGNGSVRCGSLGYSCGSPTSWEFSFSVPKWVSPSAFAHRPWWDIRAEWLFRHIIARLPVGSGAAAAADLSVSADAALAFEAVGVAHFRRVRVVLPDIGEFGIEDIAAIDGQIRTW